MQLVFPSSCAGCGTPGALICEVCSSQAAKPDPRQIPGLDHVASAFAHQDPVRTALLTAKLGGERRALRRLADALPPPPVSNAVVTWVPDTYSARLARGGSVAGSLAAAYSRKHGLRCLALLSMRSGKRDLGGAGRADRFKAVRGVFHAARPSPSVVILVDDVVTTGATASACAQALRAAGARSVALVTYTSADDIRTGWVFHPK